MDRFPRDICVGVLIALCLLSAAEAQTYRALDWGNPRLGKLKTVATYAVTQYGNADAVQQGKNFSIHRQDAFFLIPVMQDEKREWSVASILHGAAYGTDARLPTTREPFPAALWDIRFGTQYRQRTESGVLVTVDAAVGSASNRPFNSTQETTLSGNVMFRIPDGERNAWLAVVNYNNNREFLRNVPIPGFGYSYAPSKRLRVAAGAPFFSAEYEPTEKLLLRAVWLPIRNIHVGATYRLAKSFRIYANTEWRNYRYFRAERDDPDKRLFYYEKRLTGGIQWDINATATLDLSGGYAFDRYFFEGQTFTDRDFNRIDLQDGPFAAARLSLAF